MSHNARGLALARQRALAEAKARDEAEREQAAQQDDRSEESCLETTREPDSPANDAAENHQD